MRTMLVLLASAVAGYFIFQTAKVNPQVTRLDGWQATARTRRPYMPPPSMVQ